MSRPRCCCNVSQEPIATYFKPCGIPLRVLDQVVLPVEGLEALRLSDLEGLNTTEAAQKVGVSRFTYGRTLTCARRIVAEALIKGRALRIEGGQYAVQNECAQGGKCSIGGKAMHVIAVSSEGPSLEDLVDPRFGRAGGFLIASYEEGKDAPEISYLDNGDSQLLSQGAGIATTEHLAQAGVNVVLSGYVGPKAFEALRAADIAVVQNMDGMTVGEALGKYRAGACTEATAPNHEAGV